ncbi:MAG TPA: sigma-70 family RNA polymerase sigma factor [Phycisphaerales bacterium]|nr:sigma-70 family RNA polymerase sigma factor [Phycisphaerales bacterium]
MKSLDQRREQKLIREAAAGDREAAGELIKLHQTSVYAYILRLSGRADVAEDIVQEAFVRVLTNLDRFDPQYRFSTWLFTIARRVFLNVCEKRRPVSDSERVGEVSGRSCGIGQSWDETEDQCQTRDAVQRSLMQLTLEQREVIVLFHQHDWPIWLIAQHLEMPEGTVKSHLHRGRTKLRETLASTAAAANLIRQGVVA